MAVYAAYRHIELDNVGYGKKRSARQPNRDIFGAEFKGSPCHLRVLKPPGGGSSDIFGAPASEEAPRRRVDRNASAVPVGEDFWETPSKAVKPDGNPTAAEGRNGTDGAKEVRNGDSANANVADVGGNNAPSATQRRGRVPPGGFSSGLW